MGALLCFYRELFRPRTEYKIGFTPNMKIKKEKVFAIVAPCYNEREGISQFLDELESTLSSTPFTFHVFIIDDGSDDDTISVLNSYQFLSHYFSLDTISLEHNVGHQAAIRYGLNYINRQQQDFDGVIIMDCDGEDDPKAITKMVYIDQPEIVFVERGKRQENLGFRLAYVFYQLLFKVLTGRKISHGNFSMINSEVLHTISQQKYRHLPSLLSKQKFRKDKIKIDKRRRVHGKSKMGYGDLILHATYSIIE